MTSVRNKSTKAKRKQQTVRTIFGAFVAEVIMPDPEISGMREFSVRLLSDGEFDPAMIKKLVGRRFRVFMEEV